jgi:hypothetical protein
MAANTIPSPCPKTKLTRRRAIQNTVAVGALVLPAGAALATSDADPGLAAIEAGYARWQGLEAQKDALRERRNDLWDRARAHRPALTPEPDPDDFETGTAWVDADAAWCSALPTLRGHPDYEAGRDLDADADELCEQAEELRKEVLAIPTRSPRGLLVKLALAVEARSLDAIEDADSEDWGYAGEDFLPHLAADLRAQA